jgi:RHS repeat-associated protein
MTLNAARASSVASDTWANSTGKERDTESGNDYFGARYYASSMGRWLSPDTDFTLKRILSNPQRWNRYSYVLNDPLTRFDPDGLADFKIFDNYSDSDLPNGGRPDWSALKARAEKMGHTVTIERTTEKNQQALVSSALTTKGTNILIIGHSVLNNLVDRHADGIQLGDHTFMGNGFEPNGNIMMPFPATSAASVTILGCSSFDLGGQFPMTTFTGILDITDHESNSVTDEQAGAAWLASATSKPASQPVDYDAAAAAADSAVHNSKNTVTQGDGTKTNVDQGDRVKVQKP